MPSKQRERINRMDRVPGEDKLYIGSHRATNRPDLLAEAGITLILCVIERQGCTCEDLEIPNCHSHLIEAEDSFQENLLRRFKDTNKLIHNAVKNGGAVLVHCAQGVSRSATIACAYLMWSRQMGRDDALSIIKQARPCCKPWIGFREQLETYGRMLKDGEDVTGKVYLRWLQRFSVQRKESLAYWYSSGADEYDVDEEDYGEICDDECDDELADDDDLEGEEDDEEAESDRDESGKADLYADLDADQDEKREEAAKDEGAKDERKVVEVDGTDDEHEKNYKLDSSKETDEDDTQDEEKAYV